jgi:hypothetical protein
MSRDVDREIILWNWLDNPAHETAELIRIASGWQLRGVAVFGHEGQPCRLEYDIRCDIAWITELVTVNGYVGKQTIDIEILRNHAGEWALDGGKIWELTDCDDIDLNFSPSTNTLPIRRLELAIGESAKVRAAWLRFPSFKLEPFEQTYTRTGETTYTYESSGGKFRRELTVDAVGFVLEYPDLWRAEARTPVNSVKREQ